MWGGDGVLDPPSILSTLFLPLPLKGGIGGCNNTISWSIFVQEWLSAHPLSFMHQLPSLPRANIELTRIGLTCGGWEFPVAVQNYQTPVGHLHCSLLSWKRWGWWYLLTSIVQLHGIRMWELVPEKSKAVEFYMMGKINSIPNHPLTDNHSSALNEGVEKK